MFTNWLSRFTLWLASTHRKLAAMHLDRCVRAEQMAVEKLSAAGADADRGDLRWTEVVAFIAICVVAGCLINYGFHSVVARFHQAPDVVAYNVPALKALQPQPALTASDIHEAFTDAKLDVYADHYFFSKPVKLAIFHNHDHGFDSHTVYVPDDYVGTHIQLRHMIRNQLANIRQAEELEANSHSPEKQVVTADEIQADFANAKSGYWFRTPVQLSIYHRALGHDPRTVYVSDDFSGSRDQLRLSINAQLHSILQRDEAEIDQQRAAIEAEYQKHLSHEKAGEAIGVACGFALVSAWMGPGAYLGPTAETHHSSPAPVPEWATAGPTHWE